MSRIIDLIVAVSRAATGLAFAVLAGAVLLQVISRTFLPQSPVWTEELTRFALLYLVGFGVGLSLRSGDLVNVDLVLELIPRPARRRLEVVAALITVGFALALIAPSWQFMRIGAFQTSPALGWRMDWVFASMPLVMLMLGLFGALRARDARRGETPSLPGPGRVD
jgi:TRAP-type C4-dicarboxylate transport system permease small subunit